MYRSNGRKKCDSSKRNTMNEVVIYESSEKQIQVEVEFDGETAWLTQNQLRNLFNQTKQNISLHINNCFKEGELDKNSDVKESLTSANDGKKYKTKHYNLDVFISVGYSLYYQSVANYCL